MTQSELWLAKWQEAVDFLETNHRKPSKFIAEELKGTNADASKNEDLLQGRGVYPGLQHGGDDWLLRAVRGGGEQLPIGLCLFLQR